MIEDFEVQFFCFAIPVGSLDVEAVSIQRVLIFAVYIERRVPRDAPPRYPMGISIYELPDGQTYTPDPFPTQTKLPVAGASGRGTLTPWKADIGVAAPPQ